MRNTILVKDAYPADPLNGGDLRLWHLLSARQTNVHIVFGHQAPPVGRPLQWNGDHLAIEEMNAMPISRTQSPAAFVRDHLETAKAIHAAVATCRQAIPSGGPELVVASGHASGMLLASQRDIPFIFECCDSMAFYFLRRGRALPTKSLAKKLNAVWMSRIYRNIEAFIAHRAVATIVASAIDADYLVGKGMPRVIAIGNGTDWLNAAPAASDDANACRIGFHGGMNWEPNRVAALYLAREIMPLVQAMMPAAELHIAGGPAFPELTATDGSHGVHVHGYVDDVRAMLRTCQVYAMPMLQGSGFKNKLAEAMAIQLPVVTNPIGAEALDAEGLAALAVADTPQALAERIVQLLRDPRQRLALGQAGRRYAEAHFSWESKARQFDAVWEQFLAAKATAH